MTTTTKPKALIWTSYILQGLISTLFLMGAVMNMIGAESTVEESMEMGYPASSLLYLGIVLFIAVVLYLLPKTMILGAALLTAWLGGAVATHIIHGDPLTNTLFPVIFGVLIWVAIWLREDKVRNVFPTL